MRAVVFSLTLMGPLAGFALPAASATLRPVATLTSAQVRLSDLFDDAGANAARVLGPAPPLGGRIIVEAAQLGAIARQFGVAWQPGSLADRAVLDRPGRPLPREDALEAVRVGLRAAGAPADCDAELPGFAAPLVPFEGTVQPVASQVEYDPISGRFAAILSITGDGMEPLNTRVVGRVQETVEVAVTTSRLPAGTVLRPENVAVSRVRASQVQTEVARTPGQAVGMALRHAASPGQPMPLGDLIRPPLVLKGTAVLMRLENGGLELTGQGQALDAGAMGDHVRVLNPTSRAVLEAEVTGPDRVKVRPELDAHVGNRAHRHGRRPMTPARAFLALLAPALLAGCGSLDRLSDIGRAPEMSAITDPTKDPEWRPVSMPMPNPKPTPLEANSLWRPGSRAFFKDQRAAQVGDIVTVLVNIADTADMKNASTEARDMSQSMGVPGLFGFQNLLSTILPKPIDPSKLVSVSSNGTADGTGTIKRNENVTLRLAGVITQVLPNGNLVVAARQEVRVNSELRNLQVSGVIRPQDIASDNTVQHDRLAEARISYGGKGQMSAVQKPRWGTEIGDILLPF